MNDPGGPDLPLTGRRDRQTGMHSEDAQAELPWGRIGVTWLGSPSEVVLPLLPTSQRGGRRAGASLFPVEVCPEAGVFVLPALVRLTWGRLGEGSKHKPDEGSACGCLGAGAAPRACGWVTLCNYHTVVKAPEAGVAAGGGMPSSHLLSLFGL